MVLLFCVAFLPTEATAAPSVGGVQSAVMTDSTVGQARPVSLESDLRHLTLVQAVAIVGGAMAGGAVVDRLLDGTIFTVVGIILGATLGNEWYERGMWPF